MLMRTLSRPLLLRSVESRSPGQYLPTVCFLPLAASSTEFRPSTTGSGASSLLTSLLTFPTPRSTGCRRAPTALYCRLGVRTIFVSKNKSLGVNSFGDGGGGPDGDDRRRKAFSLVGYIVGTVVLFIGLTYVAVPAYRMFCQATSFGGTVKSRHTSKRDEDKIDTMEVVKNRLIKIRFESNVSMNMAWQFKPLQQELWVHPGETALAFYEAKNLATRPIVGISTYNVIPYEAGRYFSKIQCFCFEEQMLNPEEELDMPVFFYLDPDFAEDPALEWVDEVLLSYTFFESKDGVTLPKPPGDLLPVIPGHTGAKIPLKQG